MTADVLSARRYRHPALGGPAVRLTADTLGSAEDVTMQFFGFELENVEAVGTTTRAALGFPAWALVNDPARAHHALALVKDLQRVGKLAVVRPGAAKTELIRIGDRLGRSVPHFLPSFYEQAARDYLLHGHTSYAATMFGKAREAERVHALPVDAERQRSAFLEFSLVRAVTAKDLSAYAADLMSRRAAVEAYEEFWALCLQWIRTGLTPYAGIAADLRRLATAAGVAEAQDALLREIVVSPAVDRVSFGFWRSSRAAVVSLARRDPEFRGKLLSFVPSCDGEVAEFWLELLTSAGAIELLEGKAETARWLSDFVTAVSIWRPAYACVPLRELIVSLAPRLVDEVDIFRRRQDDLDLIDLCVEHGVPLGNLPREFVISGLGERDLTALAADERCRPALLAAVADHLPGKEGMARLGRLVTVPGLRRAVADWLTEVSEAIATGRIAATEQKLRSLSGVRTPEAFRLAPAAAARIGNADLAELLARTLRAGLLDEFGWPALESAVEKLLDGDQPEDGVAGAVSVVGEGWPALVLRRGERLLVVDPDGVQLEHTLRVPADYVTASYVDGQLLVCWIAGEKRLAYWSDRPAEIFEPAGNFHVTRYDGLPPASLPVLGGRFIGGGVLRVGDRTVPARLRAHGDGTTFWGVERQNYRWTWRPAGLPSFLSGPGVDLERSAMRTGVPTGSPLGAVDGTYGWRLSRQADRTWLGEGIDGRRIAVDSENHVPLAAIHLPGRDDPAAVVACAESHLELFDFAGLVSKVPHRTYRPAMARGTLLLPPLDWWHFLRVRDETGSRVLREITTDTARRLLAADRPEDEIRALGVRHPGLVAGVAGMVRYTASFRSTLAEFRDIAGKVAAAKPIRVRPELTVGQLDDALHWGLRWNRGLPSGPDRILPLIDQLGELAEHTRTGNWPQRYELGDATSYDWVEPLLSPGVLAWRAALSTTRAETRDVLVTLLTALAVNGLTEQGSHWRLAEVTVAERNPNRWMRVQRVQGGFGVLLGFERTYQRGDCIALQFSVQADQFRLPSGWTMDAVHPLDGVFDLSRIETFCRALNENGPMPWLPAAVAELASQTGLSVAEAGYLLAGALDARSSADMLSPEIRDLLGLTANQATMAKRSLRWLPERDVNAILQAAIPADPSRLWTDGPDIASAAAEWNRRLGRRTPVDDDLLAEVTRMMTPRDGAGALAAALSPAVRRLREPDPDDLRDVLRLLAYRLPDPGYSQVPPADLVEQAMVRLRIDADAATFYLQLLALPDPTDANVLRWNGWKAARLRKAGAVLLDAGLVSRARRARAGRSLFLPGGWLDLRNPRRPVEEWKKSLLAADGLPVGSVRECFRLAWQRIEDGDLPAYEELDR